MESQVNPNRCLHTTLDRPRLAATPELIGRMVLDLFATCLVASSRTQLRTILMFLILLLVRCSELTAGFLRLHHASETPTSPLDYSRVDCSNF